MVAGPPGLAGQPFRFHLDRGDESGPGVGRQPGIESDGSVVVGPIPQVPPTTYGVVGGGLVLSGGPDPSAPQLQHAERLGLCRVNQRLFRLRLENGGAGDLVDLGLREAPVAHGLVGGGKRSEPAGGLEGGDGRTHSGSRGFGEVCGCRTVALATPYVGRLHSPSRENLPTRGKLLDFGEDLEHSGCIGPIQPLGLEVGQCGAELARHPPQCLERHAAMVPAGCFTGWKALVDRGSAGGHR